MSENVALQTQRQLSNAIGRSREVEEAAELQARLDAELAPDPDSPFTRKERDTQKAEFDKAGTLVAAAGLSMVLGPIGVLTAGAMGMAGQKVRQNALDRWSEQQSADRNLAAESYSYVMDQVYDLREAEGMSPEDLGRLDLIEANLQRGLDYSNRGYLAEGEQLIGGSLNALNTLLVDNEKQRMDAEAAETQRKAGVEKDIMTAHDNILSKLQESSALYLDARTRGEYINNMMRGGNSVEILSALSQQPLFLNPQAGAVGEGEIKAWNEGIASIYERFQGRVEREIKNTGQVSNETRREFIAANKQALGRLDAIQVFNQSEALTQAQNRGVTEPKLLQEYNISGRAPTIPEVEFENTFSRSQEVYRNTNGDLVRRVDYGDGRAGWEPVEDDNTVESDIRGFIDSAADTISDTVDGVSDWYSGQGREQRRLERNQFNAERGRLDLIDPGPQPTN